MIDFSARESHFADHLAPIWKAIPAELRGTFFVGSQVVAKHARRTLDVDDVAIGYPSRDRALGPIVCSSWGDATVALRTRRKVVLAEHGAGQSYGPIRHTSYAGGRGRGDVALFLVPNRAAADRNLRYYRNVPTAVVGSPRVDELRKLPPPPTVPATVGISFHWRCTVTPESGTALDDFVGELADTRARLAAEGIRLLGHAHPRIYYEALGAYHEAGIETVSSFAEIVRRAHVYAVDNSSTLYEFAALDRPVVALNASTYRRNVAFGLRFWSEADVGLQAEPGELADRLIEAFEDRPHVAERRREIVAAVYPCTDATSADRAAEAIVSLIRGKCPLCGIAACSCATSNPTTTVVEERRERSRMPLKIYEDPDRPGSHLRLNARDAERLGLTGKEIGPVRPVAPPTPNDKPVDDPPVDDPTATTPAEPPKAKVRKPPKPEGALDPGGVTARARARRTPATDPVPDAEGDLEPESKPRPAPSSRRRRKVDEEPSS